MPGISDPGERLVRAAAGGPAYASRSCPGPSAAVAALVVSGLPTGRFVFEGFLPRKGSGRPERLAELAGERAHRRPLRGAAPPGPHPGRPGRACLRWRSAGGAGPGADQAPRGGVARARSRDAVATCAGGRAPGRVRGRGRRRPAARRPRRRRGGRRGGRGRGCRPFRGETPRPGWWPSWASSRRARRTPRSRRFGRGRRAPRDGGSGDRSAAHGTRPHASRLHPQPAPTRGPSIGCGSGREP